MAPKSRKLLLFTLIASFLFAAVQPSWSADSTIFGPKEFKIKNWGYLFESKKFKDKTPGDAVLTVTKITPEKKIRAGFLLLNGRPISLGNFLRGQELNFTKNVSLKSRNRLRVFLWGQRKAAIEIVIKKGGVVPPPQVSFSAAPTDISFGESSTLTWNTSDAQTVTIDQGVGAVSPAGSISVAPQQTTTYTLTAEGPGGTTTAQASVNVTMPAPTVSMTANPSTILTGESATLTWSATNTDTAIIDQGIGSVPPNGAVAVVPSETTTYTITVSGPGGSATSSATVTVPPVPTVTITVTPTTIIAGESATLSWSSNNADTCVIEPGIGVVAPSGSLSVTPTETTTYTVTVTGQGGQATAGTTVVVTIPAPSVTISANPVEILLGASATLTWRSSHADSCTIEPGIGSVDVNGSIQVSPTETTTYTITVKNKSGTTTAQATVTVINTAPAANSQSVTLDEDTTVSITLTGSDADNDPITYQVISQPISGTLSETAPNLSYTPAADYNGMDSFTFTVNDGIADSAPATVSITINALNDPPTANDDSAVTDANTSVTTGNVLANDTDVEGDPLTVSGFTQPTHGTVANHGDGTFTYTPHTSFYGSDSFTYTASDGNGGTDTATVTITVHNVNITVDYEYDVLGRLIRVIYKSGFQIESEIEYEYDDKGNRTKKTVSIHQP